MVVTTTLKRELAIERSIRILSELFDEKALHRVRIQFWDGNYWPNSDPRPVTLILKHPGALRSMFLLERR
jgi:hypothetical protein